MTTPEFLKLVADRLEKIQETLGRKGKEYARGDRLSNFKRAASIQRMSPEKAWLGIWAKHLVSILDMIDDIEQGCSNAPMELWDEKIGDSVNYLILLEGLVWERIRHKDLTAQALVEAADRVQRETRPHVKHRRR